jgi:hypothetical protein
MARIRTLKPEFWDHPQLNRASVLARLTFVGLINFADDEGRGRADEDWLWGRLHSGQGPNVRRLWPGCLQELADLQDDNGPLVVFYGLANARYYWLPGFCRQQYIEKAGKSKLPPPPKLGDRSPTSPHLLPSGTGIRDQGSRKGGEGSGTPPLIASQLTPEPEGTGDSLAESEEAEVKRSAEAYHGWDHPSLPEKCQGIRELRAMGCSFGYIRGAAETNRPADIGFWDIIKALKASKGPRRAAVLPRTLEDHETPTERARVNGNPSNYVPPVLIERREVVQKRQDEARNQVDQILKSMDPEKLEDWSKQADAAATQAKIPEGQQRELFIKGQLRIRVAKEHGIEGI